MRPFHLPTSLFVCLFSHRQIVVPSLEKGVYIFATNDSLGMWNSVSPPHQQKLRSKQLQAALKPQHFGSKAMASRLEQARKLHISIWSFEGTLPLLPPRSPLPPPLLSQPSPSHGLCGAGWKGTSCGRAGFLESTSEDRVRPTPLRTTASAELLAHMKKVESLTGKYDPLRELGPSKHYRIVLAHPKGLYEPIYKDFAPLPDGTETYPRLYENAPKGACPFLPPPKASSEDGGEKSRSKSSKKKRSERREVHYCECCKLSFTTTVEAVLLPNIITHMYLKPTLLFHNSVPPSAQQVQDARGVCGEPCKLEGLTITLHSSAHTVLFHSEFSLSLQTSHRKPDDTLYISFYQTNTYNRTG